MDKLPIVYVRGYAGPTVGINGQVDDPFYGFNKGATHVRVGGDGDPIYYQFEGPLLRLMTDEGYRLCVDGDQARLLAEVGAPQLPAESIWVYRFYDTAATTWGPQPHENFVERLLHRAEHMTSAPGYDIETAAAGLYDLVLLVLARTGAEKVFLVAHSMGGLICRSMMQKVCATADKDGKPRRPAKEIVAKLFTYGTPHGGITFGIPGGTLFEQVVGPAGADIFAPAKMYGYLTPGATFGDLAPGGWNPQVIPPDVFDAKDVFCVIGTDPTDYGLLPRTAVGPRSDGLVRIEHAYVVGSHRAFVHKSHSGSYGEVNSEEGYQNLRRFLFGRWAVTASLCDLTPYDESLPAWQADVRLAVRGNSVIMSEQTAAHWCPVLLNQEAQQRQGNPGDKGVNAPVPLIGTFLLDPRELPTGQDLHDGRARYALDLSVSMVPESDAGFDFRQHLEGVSSWHDTLVVDVAAAPTGDGLAAWAVWAGSLPSTVPDDLATLDGSAMQFDAGGRAVVALPPKARTLPILGPAGTLALSVAART